MQLAVFVVADCVGHSTRHPHAVDLVAAINRGGFGISARCAVKQKIAPIVVDGSRRIGLFNRVACGGEPTSKVWPNAARISVAEVAKTFGKG